MARRKKIRTYVPTPKPGPKKTGRHTSPHKEREHEETRFQGAHDPSEEFLQNYHDRPVSEAIAMLYSGRLAEPAPLQRTPREHPEQEAVRHKVKKGETLWSLSKKYYGTGTKTDYIYYANRDQIQNPDLLPEEATIVIPYVNTISGKENPKEKINSQNETDQSRHYVDHFKFLLKAKSHAVIESQKRYLDTLKKEYQSMAAVEQLIKVKETDDKLAQKELEFEKQLTLPEVSHALSQAYAITPEPEQLQALKGKVELIQALRRQLVTAYPALKVIRGKKIPDARQELQGQIITGLGGMQDDLGVAWKTIQEEDIPLNHLSPVIEAIFQAENISSERAKAGDVKSREVLDWLKYQKYEQTAISIGGFVVSLGLLIASALSGGTLAPMALSVASAIVATGTSAYDLEMAHDIYQVAKAGEGKLTGVENAKFSYLMGIVSLTLDAISVGKIVKTAVLARSGRFQKIIDASKKLGKDFSGKADKAAVYGKILNLPEKEFDLAMDILQRRNLQWIQEHHWINEKLLNHPIWKKYKISIHGDWNKNYLVGHAGRHPERYLMENENFLDGLLRVSEANNFTKEKVLLYLERRADSLRKSVKQNPTALYQNPEKPVIILE